MVFVFLFLIYLTQLINPRAVHVVANHIISLFLMAE